MHGLANADTLEASRLGNLLSVRACPTRLRDATKGKSVLLLVDGQPCRVKLGQHVKLSLRTKDIATAKERYRDASAALQEHLRVIQQTAEDGLGAQSETEALWYGGSTSPLFKSRSAV